MESDVVKWRKLLRLSSSAPSRSQTHPNLPQGKEQVTLILSKTVRCKLPLNIDNTLIIRHNSICPSPSGEVRWGLIWLRWRQMLWIVGSYSVYHHQPPHVLPRRGDASYSDWSVSYFRPVSIAAGWWTLSTHRFIYPYFWFQFPYFFSPTISLALSRAILMWLQMFSSPTDS